MKTITKDFYNKIAHEGGIYDTKTYRYVIESPTEIKRLRVEYLDTTAAYTGWELLTVKQ